MAPATDDGFDAWKADANRACVLRFDVSLDDLPDCPYWSWYDAGITPTVAAIRAIQRAQGEEDPE